jgi:GNAT superfamily N-acetyltransferase
VSHFPVAASQPQQLAVERSTPEAIAPLRELHRQEMNCQIVRDSFPRRGFSDCLMLLADGLAVGYGAIDIKIDPGTIHEFYVVPEYRRWALPLFREMAAMGGARWIRVQTNDRLLLLMLYDCATGIEVENVLFADALTTALPCPDGVLQRKPGEEEEWRVVVGDTIAATAGVLFHYNPPYADIYMEVDERFRRRGFGSYLVQEVKRVAYELGKRPAARCNADNAASRRTLERAGMLPCGRILRGAVVPRD